MLNRFLLTLPLTIPLCGYSQGYADSPFYKIVSAIPSTAHAVGAENLRTRANGIVIDVSMLEPAPFTPRLTNAWADTSTPEHIFHYFRQYDELNAVFGYDLRLEPVQGTDQIRCTFTSLSDPIDDPPQQIPEVGSGASQEGLSGCCASRRSKPFRDQIWRCNLDHYASARSRQGCRGSISSTDTDRSGTRLRLTSMIRPMFRLSSYPLCRCGRVTAYWELTDR